jgi:phosphopantetheinyl transferase
MEIILIRGGAGAAGRLRNLSSNEGERAARMARPVLQLRFAARRVILREILARDAPRNVALRYGQNGKPIPEATEAASLHFNASNCDDRWRLV